MEVRKRDERIQQLELEVDSMRKELVNIKNPKKQSD